MERILSKLTTNKVGEKVTLSGWVAKVRDHGQLIFIDLRDWSGIVQLVVDSKNKEMFEIAKDLGSEYVITVDGQVQERTKELINEKLETGKIEVRVEKLEVLTESKTPPFPLDDDGSDIDEQVRFKYRYIDIRRKRLADIIKKKHAVLSAIRNWMNKEEFTEVITPLLTSTSPEGARDFIVPSRLHKGKYFVLPQAPQQYKQLLMVGGVDKYFQVAPCARDEDPRADRHAGVFYQIDMEMSFPTIDKLLGTCENLIKDTYKIVSEDKEIVEFPFPRITYTDSMNRFGSDKPDLRFEMELQDITDIVKDKTEFNVFNNAEVIKVINAQGCGQWSRKDIEEMETYAKNFGAKGLAYVKVTGEVFESGIAKFIPTELHSKIISKLSAKDGDLLFFAADSLEVSNKVLGAVRSKLGDILGLKDKNKLSFAWITDFPFYEKNEQTGEIEVGHNPFSMPKGGVKALENEDPLTIMSHQYDLAINGYEILSGSIRNHDPKGLIKAFEILGYSEQEIKKRFGAMYNAFQYGAPPHGGWAIGFDRLFMVLIDEENIRDTYAFPKNSNGMDLMMDAPSDVPQKDLNILGVKSDMRGEEVAYKIKRKLDNNNVEYENFTHKAVTTSEEAAQLRDGIEVSDGAKSMVLHSKEYSDKYIMVVIPADKQLNVMKVNEVLGEKFGLATKEMLNQEIGLEIGSVPPFGRLLGLEVYFDESMYKKETSAFNIGLKTESIIMKTSDLIKYVQPNKISIETSFIK